MATAAFNSERFAKVKTLHDRTDIPGERSAAAERMAAMAAKAGLTLDEAIRKAGCKPARKPRKPASSPRQKPPPRQHAPRSMAWQRIIVKYGSEAAVFAPGRLERALNAACERFTVTKETTGWPIGSLWGWTYASFGEPAQPIIDAVSAASPLPANMQGLWAEYEKWNELCSDREVRATGDGVPSPAVAIRMRLLEQLLDKTPARSVNDVRARFWWMQHLIKTGFQLNEADNLRRLAVLKADFERMAERLRDVSHPYH